MLERLIKQFNEYKNKYLQKFNSIFNSSSKFTYDIFDTSKKRLESEKIKIKLKKLTTGSDL